MEKSRQLLIFNGECACDCWKRVDPGSALPFLVWRENYLEGPLVPDVSLPEFERIRAEFLHSCVPEYSADRIRSSLMSLHETLKEFDDEQCEIVLYFDCCMYDMIMLARIFSLLERSKAQIRLFCEDVILGSAPEVFGKAYDSLEIISVETRKVYARAWTSVLQGPLGVEEFNRKNIAEYVPHLAEGMLRYGEDHPADGSMGRSQKQLLAIVQRGIHTFPEIFTAFDRYERYMFMGDTFCLRLLLDLVRKGFLVKQEPAQGEEFPSFYLSAMSL